MVLLSIEHVAFSNNVACVSDLLLDTDLVLSWKLHSSDLPNWATAARVVLLIQLLSAAAQQVFSILSSSFGDHQHCSLHRTM